jgi:hypothetical protein
VVGASRSVVVSEKLDCWGWKKESFATYCRKAPEEYPQEVMKRSANMV